MIVRDPTRYGGDGEGDESDSVMLGHIRHDMAEILRRPYSINRPVLYAIALLSLAVSISSHCNVQSLREELKAKDYLATPNLVDKVEITPADVPDGIR